VSTERSPVNASRVCKRIHTGSSNEIEVDWGKRGMGNRSQEFRDEHCINK
jgi:hypothetical protein